MAGRYYSATPIGAGLGNIAEAISGIPARREQAALLAQRRDLVASQILTDAAHRGHYEEQTAGLRQAREGREGMARVFEESGTTGNGGPPADPQPSPEPVGITTAFMADRMPGDPISVAPAAPVAPTAPAEPAAPNVANAVVGPNRTGWTPERNNRYYAAAVRANEDKAADYVRGYMGGNLAATEQNPDRALSYGQAGAGQNWRTTVAGEGARLEETKRKDDQTSADKRYQADQQRAASQYGADARAGATRDAAVTRANAPGKAGAGGKGKARELTPAQQSKLMDEVRVEGGKKLGRPLTEQEARSVVGAISDEFTSGSGYTDAKALVLDNLVTGDKGEKSAWYNPFGKDVPDTRKLNIPARAARTADAPAAPAAPGKPGKDFNSPGLEGGSASAAAGSQADILQQEVRKAQGELATAQSKGDKEGAARAQADLDGLQRELGRLPGGRRAPPAPAPAPAAAAPAAPAPPTSGKALEARIAKAKANGWTDQQIAAQIAKEQRAAKGQ